MLVWIRHELNYSVKVITFLVGLLGQTNICLTQWIIDWAQLEQNKAVYNPHHPYQYSIVRAPLSAYWPGSRRDGIWKNFDSVQFVAAGWILTLGIVSNKTDLHPALHGSHTTTTTFISTVVAKWHRPDPDLTNISRPLTLTNTSSRLVVRWRNWAILIYL